MGPSLNQTRSDLNSHYSDRLLGKQSKRVPSQHIGACYSPTHLLIIPPNRRMPLGLKRQRNAPCRAYECGFCDVVAPLQQKMCCRPNLTPPRETRPARYAAKNYRIVMFTRAPAPRPPNHPPHGPIVHGHRRVSLLGSTENERAIFSESITQRSPGRGRGFLIRRSLGEISTSQ